MNKLKALLFKKSNLWHVGAIALFLLISCVYFSPALNGYALKQGDVTNYIGASREIVDYRDNTGEEILWTNAMFSGMPTQQISMLYNGTWLAKGLLSIFRFGLPTPILFLFAYFLGFYILGLTLRIKPLWSIVGSLGFGLSSYFIIIIEAGHNTKANAIGLAPLMVAGFVMAYRNRNWILGVAISAIFMMLELSANHVQITYYMIILLFFMGVVELVRHLHKKELARFFKITGLMVVGYGLAFLVNVGNIMGTMEYANETIRGGTELTILPNGEPNENIKTSGLDREYVTNWSLGRDETFTLFVPNFKGGETAAIGQDDANKDLLKKVDGQLRQNIAGSNQYWGDQPFTSGAVYLGIIMLFLAALGLVYIKDKYKWALLSATLLTIMLSWGKNYVSALVLLPIVLYMVNLFLDEKKRVAFTIGNTLLLVIAVAIGEAIVPISLTDFFLDYVSGYNKFRAVTILLVVAALCIPVLAVLFLQRLVENKKAIVENPRGLYIVGGIFLVMLAGFYIAPGAFNTFLKSQEIGMMEAADPQLAGLYGNMFDELETVRKGIFRRDVLRSLFFFIVGAGAVFAFVRTNMSKFVLGGALGLLIVLDLLLVDMRYLNNDGRGKNYDYWVEAYEMKYPFAAGEGEKQILAMEVAANPVLGVKIDSALQVLDKELKADKDVKGRETQVRRDYLTFRVLNNNTNFRVFEEGNAFNSSYTSYFNKSIGGYHGAKLSRYQELIEFHLSRQNPAVIDMLNTKYYLRPERGANGQIANSRLTRVNENAMGNAWLTPSVKLVKNSDEEIMAMDAFNAVSLTNKGLGQVLVNGQPVQSDELKGSEAISILLPGMPEALPVENVPFQAVTKEAALALIVDSTGLNWIYDSAPDSLFNKVFSLTYGGRGGWDPEKVTLMDERYAKNISQEKYTAQGTIEMTQYHPRHMRYAFSSNDPQLAVFSEIYYEAGWKALIDGKEEPISRVDYVLRALEVPAGDHEIEFIYESKSYERSGLLANVASFLLLGLLITGLFIQFKTTEEVVDEGEK